MNSAGSRPRYQPEPETPDVRVVPLQWHVWAGQICDIPPEAAAVEAAGTGAGISLTGDV